MDATARWLYWQEKRQHRISDTRSMLPAYLTACGCRSHVACPHPDVRPARLCYDWSGTVPWWERLWVLGCAATTPTVAALNAPAWSMVAKICGQYSLAGDVHYQRRL
jgi:hypothetical protein